MSTRREIWTGVAPVLGLVAGFIGTSFLAVAFTSASMSYRDGGWPWAPVLRLSQLIERFPTAAWLALLGLALLAFGWWLIRPRGSAVSLWWASLWLIPLLIGPPVMSGDAFLYADAGWLFGHGVNPYETGLCALDGPYSPSVDAMWCRNGAPYPPVAVMVAWLATLVSGAHPYFGMIAQRGVALVGWGLLAFGLPRIAERVQMSVTWVWWFALFNPVVIMHGVGGAHNDLLMAGLVVAALALVAEVRASTSTGEIWWRFLVAAALVGVAMGVKPQAGLAVWTVAGLCVPRLAQRSRWGALWRISWRAGLATLVSVGVLALVSWGSELGWGWIKALSMPGSVVTMSPYFLLNDVWQHLQVMLMIEPTPYSDSLYRVIVGVALIGFVALAVAAAGEPLKVVAWGSLLVVAASKGLLMWYFVLPVVLLALVPLKTSTIRWLTAGMVAYLFAYLWYFLYGWPIWVDLTAGLIVGGLALALTSRTRGLPQWQRKGGHV